MFSSSIAAPVHPKSLLPDQSTKQIGNITGSQPRTWEGMLAAERLDIEHFVGNPIALLDHVRFEHKGGLYYSA